MCRFPLACAFYLGISALQSPAVTITSIQRLDPAASGDFIFHGSTNFQGTFPVWYDYSFFFTSTPAYLHGADQIRTRYFSDRADADFQLQVTLAEPATVYLLIDDRVPSVAIEMPWVASMGFTDTGDEATIQVSFDSVLTTASIYKADFPAGDIVLLQQNDSSSGSAMSGMYTIAATPVPEPGFAALATIGMLLGMRRRRG